MKNVNASVLSNITDASSNGAAIDSSQIYQVSFQTIIAQTDVTGTMKVQMSNDINRNGMLKTNFVPTHWSDIPNATATITAGVAPPITLSVVTARYLRIVFTRSGGATGAIEVTMFALCV